MNRNRAKEFMIAALSALQLPLTRNRKTAQLYIELAIDEVQELVDRLALCDMTDRELSQRIETRDASVAVMIFKKRPDIQPTGTFGLEKRS